MRFLYNNAAVLIVAGLCSAFAWLYGGTVASALLPTIPWILALLFEMMICFPQRHPGETTFDARRRVWKQMKGDPLTWVVVLFLLLLTVPFVNKGLCPGCNYPEIHFEGVRASPPFPHLPFCVDRLEHLNVAIWFFSALTAALAVKHSLLKSGKRLVLELIVWNGVALSAIGLIQYVAGAESPLWAEGWGAKTYFFSTFGYPNMCGDYFTTLFAVAVALWRRKVDEVACSERLAELSTPNRNKFWKKHYLLIPVVIFFLSALMTMSRAAIVLVCSLGMIFFFHSCLSFLHNVRRVRRVKLLAVNLLAAVFIALMFYLFFFSRGPAAATEGDIRGGLNREISSLSAETVLDRAAGHGQYHVRIAKDIWLDHFLFGCGGWGYRHFSPEKMTDEEFASIQKVGGINVHNDFLQFLAEHGLVGFALIVAIILMLFAPTVRVWKRLIASVSFLKPSMRPPRPVAIFALPAGAFCLLSAAVATLIHSTADCPLRSPAVMTLFFVVLAAVDGFLPKLKNNEN